MAGAKGTDGKLRSASLVIDWDRGGLLAKLLEPPIAKEEGTKARRISCSRGRADPRGPFAEGAGKRATLKGRWTPLSSFHGPELAGPPKGPAGAGTEARQRPAGRLRTSDKLMLAPGTRGLTTVFRFNPHHYAGQPRNGSGPPRRGTVRQIK